MSSRIPGTPISPFSPYASTSASSPYSSPRHSPRISPRGSPRAENGTFDLALGRSHRAKPSVMRLWRRVGALVFLCGCAGLLGMRNSESRGKALQVIKSTVEVTLSRASRLGFNGNGAAEKVAGFELESSIPLDAAVAAVKTLFPSDSADEPVVASSPLDRLSVVNFAEPQDVLQEQFKEGINYVTTLSWGGHANQFLAIIHLLHLAKILDRVAIIPTLIPLHFSAMAEDFSRFYDLDRMYAATGIPAVELGLVKKSDYAAPPIGKDQISCWSLAYAATRNRNLNDGSMNSHYIDVEYFPLPELKHAYHEFIHHDAIKQFHDDAAEQKSWLARVWNEYLPQKRLGKPLPGQGRRVNRNENMELGFNTHVAPSPDPHLFCLDSTFFIGSTPYDPLARNDLDHAQRIPYEVPRSYEGEAWRTAGQYIHYTKEIEQLADEYLLVLFGVETVEEIPPFITVHIRRTDFAQARGLVSIRTYVDALERVIERLQARIDDPTSWRGPGLSHAKYFGIPASQYAIVATTDDVVGSPFVDRVESLGWKVVDHVLMGTNERLDEWYGALIDGAILARGRGFVGTEWSTFSYIAGLRVKYWNGGLEEYTPVG